MDKNVKAEDVRVLLENPLLQEILQEVRQHALEKLAKTKPEDVDAIRKHQSVVQVASDFHVKAREIIAKGAQPKRLK